MTEKDIDEAVRAALKTQQCTVMLAGSALKNRGIQPLLDAIIKYLPSPLARGQLEVKYKNKTVIRSPQPQQKLCAYAFKIIHDNMHGPITFVRTYSGTLKGKSNIFNSTTKRVEKVNQLARLLADEMTHINAVSAGDIGAIVGNNEIRSGDTLIAEADKELIELEGINKHQAMFTCAINSRDKQEEKKVAQILEKMTREDPSIDVRNNEETGQMQISALGELQLEVLKDRIWSEHKIKLRYGKLRVSYRESILNTLTKKLTFEEFHGRKSIFAELEFTVEPLEEKTDNSTNELVFDIQNKGYKEIVPINHEDERYEGIMAHSEVYKSLETMPEEFESAIQDAINNSLLAGKILGYKMIGVRVTVKGGKWSNIRSNEIAFKLCASELAKQALQEASPCLLEPYAEANILVPEPCMADVLGDMTTNRRGEIKRIDETGSGKNKGIEKKRIIARLPLIELSGYANFIRTMTKGQGSYTSEFSGYQPVPEDKAQQIINDPFS